MVVEKYSDGFKYTLGDILITYGGSMATKQVLHYPNLKTVLSVEEILKEAQYPMTRYQILKKLENKVMKQTLNVVIAYLEERGLILDGQRGVLWTYMPKKKLKKRIAKGLEA